MSAPTSNAGSNGATTGSDRRAPRRESLRVRLTVGGVLLLAIAALVTIGVLQPTSTSAAGRLDPTDPQEQGARALAQVLEREGVDVEVVRNAADFSAADVDTDDTVFVSAPAVLSEQGFAQVLDRDAARVLLADPTGPVTSLLDTSPASGVAPAKVPADCSADLGVDLGSLEVEVESNAYAFDDLDGCFDDGDGPLLAVADDLDTTSVVALLGMSDALTNQAILDADNAAIALRLLGGSDRLIWYVPDPADAVGEDQPGIGEFLPDWLTPGIALLAVAAVAGALWRGRRFGRLVTEPLPVVVRGIETTLGRGSALSPHR